MGFPSLAHQASLKPFVDTFAPAGGMPRWKALFASTAVMSATLALARLPTVVAAGQFAEKHYKIFTSWLCPPSRIPMPFVGISAVKMLICISEPEGMARRS